MTLGRTRGEFCRKKRREKMKNYRFPVIQLQHRGHSKLLQDISHVLLLDVGINAIRNGKLKSAQSCELCLCGNLTLKLTKENVTK